MKNNYLYSVYKSGILLLLFVSVHSYSQESQVILELKREVLDTDSKERSSILNKRIAKFYNSASATDSALIYIQKAINTSSSLKQKDISDTYALQADIKYSSGNHKEGLIAINKAIKYFNTSNVKDNNLFAKHLFRKGSINLVLNNKIEALENLTKASRLTNNSTTKAQIYSSLSDLYVAMGDEESALEFANKLLEKPLVENISPIYVAKSYTLAAGIHFNSKDYEKAIKLEKKAIKLYRESKNTLGVSSALVNMSHSLYKAKKYNEALIILKEAETENKILKNKYVDAAISLNKAENFAQLKRFQEAYNLFDISFDKFKKLQIPEGIAESLLEKSRALYSEDKTNKALKNVKEALSMSLENGLIYIKEDCYLLLYKIYKEKQGTNEALFYYEKYTEAKESILKEEKQQSIDNLKVRFDIQRLENELELKDKELKFSEEKEKASLYLKLLLGLGILSLLFFTYRQYRLIQTRKAAFIAEKELTKIKREQLENEINLKKREVTDFAIQINDKNDILGTIKKSISSISKKSDQETKSKLRKVINDINNTIEVNQEKVAIYSKVEEVNTDFYTIISQKYPQLTNREIEITAYLRLNLSSKQIANQINISPQSVNNYRLVIRKKLNLKKSDNLSDFFKSL